jgi:hypothetical protein
VLDVQGKRTFKVVVVLKRELAVEAKAFRKGTNMLNACPFLKDAGRLKNRTCRREPGRPDKGSAVLLANGGSRLISIRSRVLNNAVSNVTNPLAKQERSLFRVCEIQLKWYMQRKVAQRRYLRLNLGEQSDMAMLMLLLLLLRLLALASLVATATISTTSTASTTSSLRVGVTASRLLLLLLLLLRALLLLELRGLLRSTTHSAELLRLILVGRQTELVSRTDVRD